MVGKPLRIIISMNPSGPSPNIIPRTTPAQIRQFSQTLLFGHLSIEL